MVYRFHVLAVPHTITTAEYSTCAFTQKVLKLCKMLRMYGHEVIHYGNEASVVDCNEHVTVTTLDDLDRSYPSYDWRKLGFPAFTLQDPIYRTFYANAISEIHRRWQKNDFLLCPFGAAHLPIALAHPDMIAVETGIGYPSGSFAKFRVFESYAIMHAYMGQGRIEHASNDLWYDSVIPNAFDLDDFTFSSLKNSNLLFLGRVNAGKGIHIAVQVAETTGRKLIVAGPGEVAQHMARTPRPISEYVQQVGVVGPKQRAELLASTRTVLCPSTFLEPFCGVQIEAMMSGTPVVSSDFGAFAEYNKHGLTGYRCHTFSQFVWAVEHAQSISPDNCRSWAERFSLQRVAQMYDEYFSMVAGVFNGKGDWYNYKADRADNDLWPLI